jgi:ATP-binding cassette subfamily C (CFTR/MRP) protein 1
MISRDHVDPARFGVVLTYALSATNSALIHHNVLYTDEVSGLSNIMPAFAQCEQEMNNVERIQYYNELEMEADSILPSDPKGDEIWPTEGKVEFEDVQLRYRPDLPLVLKGLTFKVNGAEKIGVIGRTGAGKSSVAQALFRSVEICGGRIIVDGRDLKGLGLETVSTVPGDTELLASGAISYYTTRCFSLLWNCSVRPALSDTIQILI